MQVGEAQPGQILYVKGRVPKFYTKNLSEDELLACREAGFVPGFLMPAWIKNNNPPHAWPPGKLQDTERITALFYVGPIWLHKSVGGLRKHHLFLYDGGRIGLEGYDFRHLCLLESM